jgi:hypothetical protein
MTTPYDGFVTTKLASIAVDPPAGMYPALASKTRHMADFFRQMLRTMFVF